MATRKKAALRTKAKRKKTLVTKTATPTKTKTVNYKRAMNGSPLLAPQLITGARCFTLSGYPKIRQPSQHWYQKSSDLKRGVRSL
jgi:hypothetical protein